MKKISLLWIALIAMVFASCSRDGVEPVNPTTKNGFKVRLALADSKINTYATVNPENGEEEINSIFLLFFADDANKTFIESYDASPTTGSFNMSQPLNIEFPIGSNLNNSTAYHILVVANDFKYRQDQYATTEEWIASMNDKGMDEVILTYRAAVIGDQSSNYTDNSQFVDQFGILMSAYAHKAADQETVTINLTRGVARYDIANSAAGYKLVSASIWNAYPNTAMWEKNTVNAFSDDRIERYYGVSTSTNQIIGGLYSFENFVSSPELDDTKTTCIIVGIEDASSVVTYYRINVNPKDMGQQIKRNNVYKMNIKRVLGPGAPSEKDAYTSNKFLLETNINSWGLDDMGNIKFDGDNILAIPSSSIVFGPDAETRTYDIFTLSKDPNVTLSISKLVTPPGITVTLSGKTLTVTVTDFAEDKREADVELAFGNLRAGIHITQTGRTVEFLTLSQNTVPMLPSTANQSLDDIIYVASSGPWKAEIFNGGFSFQGGGTVLNNKLSGEGFNIQTASVNTDPNPRFAFVLVTLISNPDISRVVVLSQRGSGDVVITPGGQSSIAFDANGATTDNTVFTINSGDDSWVATSSSSKIVLSQTTGTSTQGFTVSAAGINETEVINATVKVSLANNPAVYKIINVTQAKHHLSLNLTTFSDVPSAGGSTPNIVVTSSGAWTATVTASANTTGGLNAGMTQTATGVSGGMFTVRFPALSVQQVVPSITVTIKVNGTSLQEVITVKQIKLNPLPVLVVSKSTSYGSLANSDPRMTQIRNFLDNSSMFGTSGTVLSGAITRRSTASNYPTSGGNFYANIFNWNMGNEGAGTDIANAVRVWMAEKPTNVLIMQSDYYYGGAGVQAFNPLGYYGVQAGAGGARPNGNSTKSKIHEYLLKTGPFTNGTEININSINFGVGDTSRGALSSFPATFIPVIVDNNGRPVFGIDPTLRVVYIGNNEMFSSASSFPDGGANYKFVQNMVAWMIETTQKGDAFTTQFR